MTLRFPETITEKAVMLKKRIGSFSSKIQGTSFSQIRLDDDYKILRDT